MADGVEGRIERLIAERGKITFAQFMDMALFSPDGGYYTSGGPQKRDYYTAPAAHPVFGALVALHLEHTWELMGSPSPFYVVEVGAGSCALARDIAAYSSALSPAYSSALEYIGVDYAPSPPSQADVQAVRGRGLPFRDVVGCVISNELLDAFPVHRFAVQGGRLKEVYVTLEEGWLVDALDEPSTPMLERRLSGLGVDLPEGFRGEVNLAMDDWVEELSHALSRGLALTIDYGHEARDLYSPARSGGTLRCYYDHVLEGNPYRRIGRQDITAHVDFTSLARSGEGSGLSTVGLTTQREFLHSLGFSTFLDSLSGMALTQRERDSNRMGMLDLVKAGGMGDFKVLAQAKGLRQGVALAGFSPGGALSGRERTAGELPPTPLLSSEHLDLMAGRYPHLSWEWEDLWPFGQGGAE